MAKKRFLGGLTVCTIACFVPLLISATQSHADPVNLNSLTSSQQKLLDEHVFGGLPSAQNIYIRKGYVLCFNPTTKTPNWVAYHVIKEGGRLPSAKVNSRAFETTPILRAKRRTTITLAYSPAVARLEATSPRTP
jgi:DNA/RNA endonuclease G (NUC1)